VSVYMRELAPAHCTTTQHVPSDAIGIAPQVRAVHAGRGDDASDKARINVDGKSPTLISSYHKACSFSTRFLFEQADGTRCDGEGGNRRPRFLTPRECCRIMGFPEDFAVPPPASSPASPTAGQGQGKEALEVARFYRAIGNAVTPPVIAALGSELIRCLRDAPASTS
jgi:site-specific DNA-cytosine methylase